MFGEFFSNAWSEVTDFYDKRIAPKAAKWGADVKEQFGKMVEEGRNLRVSTISKMLSRSIKG